MLLTGTKKTESKVDFFQICKILMSSAANQIYRTYTIFVSGNLRFNNKLINAKKKYTVYIYISVHETTCFRKCSMKGIRA